MLVNFSIVAIVYRFLFLSSNYSVLSFRVPFAKRNVFRLFQEPKQQVHELCAPKSLFACFFVSLALQLGSSISPALALDGITDSSAAPVAVESTSLKKSADYKSFRLPYEHVNLPMSEFLGKATLVVNMKLDDPQTPTQFPILVETFNKYSKDGLNVIIFPTEQGYFEPDDDETCRAKAKEYYGFGSYPNAVVFDKIDLIGPSGHPLYIELTTAMPTPNGYSRITLNYEKFLLNAEGEPVRRYPRKFSPNDFEADIVAVLKGQPVPAESPEYERAWREAKREAQKSEYAFRLNYNYYSSPDSMYKYNPEKDR